MACRASPQAFFSFQVLPAYVNDSGRFNPCSRPYERAAQLQDKNDHHALITSVYNSAAFEYTSDQLGCLGTFDIESAAACDALLTLPQAD